MTLELVYKTVNRFTRSLLILIELWLLEPLINKGVAVDQERAAAVISGSLHFQHYDIRKIKLPVKGC